MCKFQLVIRTQLRFLIDWNWFNYPDKKAAKKHVSIWYKKKRTTNQKVNCEQWKFVIRNCQKMDFSGTNSINMKPFLGGYPFQGKIFYAHFKS